MITTLKNGSILLEERLVKDYKDGSVVLAKTKNGYATWAKDGEGNTFVGHYFDHKGGTSDGTTYVLKSAIEDYNTRH